MRARRPRGRPGSGSASRPPERHGHRTRRSHGPPGRRPAAGGFGLYRVIHESDTQAERLFDKIIVAAILVSVAVVMADSVRAWNLRHRTMFEVVEWFFTLLFTFEYIARLAAVERPLRHARSFFGIVDLLAVLPTYLALIVPELHALIDVRILRLLRIFRIFRLTEYVGYGPEAKFCRQCGTPLPPPG